MSDALACLLENEFPLAVAFFSKIQTSRSLAVKQSSFLFQESQKRIKGRAKLARQQDRIAGIKRLSQSKPQTQVDGRAFALPAFPAREAKEGKEVGGRRKEEGRLPPPPTLCAHTTHRG